MKKIYIISMNNYAGKTVVGIGLINILIEKGYKVGYIKPIGTIPQVIGSCVYDASALLVKKIFSLEEKDEIISPFVATYDVIQSVIREGTTIEIKKKILNAIESINNKDFLIMSAAGDFFTGAIFGLNLVDFIKEIDAKVLLVESFANELIVDNIIGVYNILKDNIVGCVINRIPKNVLKYVEKDLKSFLEKKGIKVFGCFEKDEILGALTVRDLVSILDGKVLCCEDKLDEIVEHYSIGAMDVSNAFKYFKRINNKAVITGSHRTDIQLAALETSTKVIILTGGTGVNDVVLAKAISCGVPLVSVEYDTFSVVDKIELVVGKVRIKEGEKIDKIKKMFKEKFDLERFLEAL
ncbi:MAG: phosphotransacetylase family protein [Elusimicrobiota bacterium]|nr:phosphotransacetylase family protein [Endomicrobiia bacterium]MDW8166093.1 phosphotransacetylase family protein [Elusimicrobiota bacterium]